MTKPKPHPFPFKSRIIAHGTVPCRTCHEPHDCHTVQAKRSDGSRFTMDSWDAEDGHTYEAMNAVEVVRHYGLEKA